MANLAFQVLPPKPASQSRALLCHACIPFYNQDNQGPVPLKIQQEKLAVLIADKPLTVCRAVGPDGSN